MFHPISRTWSHLFLLNWMAKSAITLMALLVRVISIWITPARRENVPDISRPLAFMAGSQTLMEGRRAMLFLGTPFFLYDLAICLLPTQNSPFLEGCTLPWACQLHLQGQRGHPGHRSQGHWTPGAPQLAEHQNQPPSVSQRAKYGCAVRDRRHKWIKSGTLLTAGLPPRSPPIWGRRRGESTQIHPLVQNFIILF